MSENTAQIYRPEVGRRYRIEIDGDSFVGIVVGWDQETVDVKTCEPDRRMPELIHLHRARAIRPRAE